MAVMIVRLLSTANPMRPLCSGPEPWSLAAGHSSCRPYLAGQYFPAGESIQVSMSGVQAQLKGSKAEWFHKNERAQGIDAARRRVRTLMSAPTALRLAATLALCQARLLTGGREKP